MIELRAFQPGDEPALRAVFESAVRGTARRDYSQLQVDTWAPRDYDPAAWALRVQGIQPFVALVDGASRAMQTCRPAATSTTSTSRPRWARRVSAAR